MWFPFVWYMIVLKQKTGHTHKGIYIHTHRDPLKLLRIAVAGKSRCLQSDEGYIPSSPKSLLLFGYFRITRLESRSLRPTRPCRKHSRAKVYQQGVQGFVKGKILKSGPQMSTIPARRALRQPKTSAWRAGQKH